MLTKQNYFLGLVCCFLATTFWGIMYLVLGFSLQYIDPINITVIRFIITAITFIILFAVVEGLKAFKMTLKQALIAFIVGSLGFSGTAFLTLIAQDLIGSEGAVTVAIILSTSPVISLLVVWVLKNQRPTMFGFLCILVSFVGIVLVVTKGNIGVLFDNKMHPFANLLILVAVLNFVLYSMASQLFPMWSSLKYSSITTVMGTITLVSIGVICNVSGLEQWPSFNAVVSVLPYMLYVSCIATALGLLLWTYGVRTVGATNAMPFMNITPIVALVGSLFFGVVPTFIQLIGVIITISALVSYNVYQRIRVKSVKS